MYAFEEALWHQGYRHVAGCDEVGRGPLAGPLVCAAVILNPNQQIEGLYDSKALSEKQRLMLSDAIKQHAIAYSVVFIDVKTVDAINVYQASKQGMLQAVNQLAVKADYILSDAMPFTNLSIPHQSLIKGDQKSATIAAASILAKVERDEYMVQLSNQYPHYGFNKHKGYPTKVHREALQTYGVTPHHRTSFKPVRALIDVQKKLDI